MNQEGKKEVKSSGSEDREATRDFLTWLDQHKQLPSDNNQAFVIGSESSLDSDFHFRVVFSTRKMLDTLPTAKEVYVDTAHWFGFSFTS